MMVATPRTAASRRRWVWWCAGGFVVLAIIGIWFFATRAASPPAAAAVIGRRGQPDSKNQSRSIEGIDHGAWDALLQRYVNAKGLVDYARWKSSPADVAALDDYLLHLSKADLKQNASREARLAFWINAYNALTVRSVLREYPNSSVQSNSLPPKEPAKELRFPVGESSFTLDEIEHQVLRPLNEPEIHFAIVCGARGCPRLLNRAYTAPALEGQLHENSKQFFADSSKLAVEGDSEVRLSPILKWYAEDFGKTPTEVLQTIAPYVPDELRAKLLGQRVPRISYLDYDWSLNDQAAAAGPPLPPEPVPGEVPHSPK